MKEKFITNGINFINKYQECDELKIKKLKYGLEGLYSLIIKTTTVIILSALLNTLKETCLIILFYAGIRTFSFGIHAKSNIACWITTITLYNIIPLFIKNLTIPQSFGYIALIISFISMLLWSPADTPKRPLIRKKHRLKCKLLSLMVVTLYTILFCFNNIEIINNSIIYALLMQCILINPLTYKITKTTFNNYKYYKKTKMV